MRTNKQPLNSLNGSLTWNKKVCFQHFEALKLIQRREGETLIFEALAYSGHFVHSDMIKSFSGRVEKKSLNLVDKNLSLPS